MTTNSNNNMEPDLCISASEVNKYPDLREELKKREEGEERNAFAIRAMRIGVMAIHHAQGQIDADKIREEGNRIIEKTESTLTNYLDPDKGKFHQQIHRLIKKDGELVTVIRQQIAGDKSPLGETMTERNQTILDNFLKHFDLTKDGSALKLMLKQLEEKYDQILEKIGEEKGREEESGRSTRHGVKFENVTVSNFIQEWNNRKCDANHIVEHTGSKPGNLSAKKGFRTIGDFVIELGPDHAAAGCKIVVEAKANQEYTLDKAFKELEDARKNRGAEVGLFVLDKNKAPDGFAYFTRRGNDTVIVWDAGDSNSDVIFEVGLSVAVALCVQAENRKKADSADVKSMKNIVKEIEEVLDNLDAIEKSAQAIKSGNNKILDKIDEMKSKLPEKLSRLNDQINKLR